jgi:amino acid transporter
VNIFWAALVVAAFAAAAVALMLAVRRRAPEGSFYSDSDRAAGVFGVLATGFSVLLGFLIFLAFESYDAARTGAETEALTVAQQIQTAQLLPSDAGADLTGQLVCYARSVVNEEWDRMEEGSLGEDINRWGPPLFRSIEDVELDSPTEEAAYGKWLDQTSERERARQDRIHGAAGVMPLPLWIVLFFISVIVVVFLLGFADRGERAIVQGLFMGSVVAVIVAMLLLLNFLDDPVNPGIGGLQPVAMERTLMIIDQQLEVIGQDVTIPCNASGVPE